MVTYSTQQVLGLATDDKAAERARAAAALRHWSGLGQSERACWGLASGSGKAPYQVSVDLHEPAFRCSCPSKRFPCKHGLALLLIHSESISALAHESPPDWVADWLAKRDERAESTAAHEAAPVAVRDEAAQAKRLSAREEKVAGGMAELAVWLADLARQGLADLPARPYELWDRMAARLVDAQCAPLARQVRELGGLVVSGPGWEDRVLERLGSLQLIVASWARIESLPALLAADLRTQIGFTPNLREQAAGDGIADSWQVVARTVEEEERLRVQRTWLRGEGCGQTALILDFAHGGGPLDTSMVPGSRLCAELVFLPSGVPLRAVLKVRHEPPTDERPATGWHPDIATLLTDYADCLGRNPWHGRHPVALAAAQLQLHDTRWLVADTAGAALPLAADGAPYWDLLAATASQPLPLFGEYDGHSLTPHAVAINGVWRG